MINNTGINGNLLIASSQQQIEPLRHLSLPNLQSEDFNSDQQSAHSHSSPSYHQRQARFSSAAATPPIQWTKNPVWFIWAYLQFLAFKLFFKIVPSSVEFLNQFVGKEKERKLSRQQHKPQQQTVHSPNCTRKFSGSLTSCCQRLSRSRSGSYSSFYEKSKQQQSQPSASDYLESFESLFTVPNDLLSFSNLFLNILLELTFLARLQRFVSQIRERYRNMFRWRPTSSEELDQCEQRVLSYLKCDHKNYYVDIGKGWNLDRVLIWTMEVPKISSLPTTPKQQNGALGRFIQPVKTESTSQFDLKTSSNSDLPIVMIHGFASGLGLWTVNMDELAQNVNRTIFAFDMLGFAKSSRPKFTFPKFSGLTSLQQSKAEAETIEEYLVESVEKWRSAIGGPLQNKFILLGHSFGGYLSLAYALRYPQHVAHVILADPWGFPPENYSRHLSTTQYNHNRQLPFLLRCLGKLFLEVLTPLAVLRASGPWGPTLISRLRPDLRRKFDRFTSSASENESGIAEASDADISSNSEDESESTRTKANSNALVANDGSSFIDYMYHCNAQSPPSGEIAFQKLCTSTGWARIPMLERIIELDPQISLSFIYGSRSWIDRQAGFQAKYILATAASAATNNDSSDETETVNLRTSERVNIHVLQGAGHHVYADMPEEFNQLVVKICSDVDSQLQQKYLQINSDQLDDDDSFLQQQLQNNRNQVSSGDHLTQMLSDSKVTVEANGGTIPVGNGNTAPKVDILAQPSSADVSTSSPPLSSSPSHRLSGSFPKLVIPEEGSF